LRKSTQRAKIFKSFYAYQAEACFFCRQKGLFMLKFKSMKVNKEEIKSVLKYLKPYKKIIILAGVFAMAENLSQLAAPIIYGSTIDVLSKNQSVEKKIILLLVAWLVVVFLGDWFGRMKSKRASEIAYNASQDILVKPVAHLVKLPVSFHKNKKIGEIIQRFTRADGYMYQLVENGMFEMAPMIVNAILAFAIIAWIRWQLAVVYIFFISAYFVLTIRRTNPIIEHQKKLNRVFEKAYGDIFDRTENIISIKSNTAEEEENQRNAENYSRGFKHLTAHMSLWLRLSFWQSLLFVVNFIILFALGLFYIRAGQITFGQFVMLLAYINILSSALTGLGGNYKRLQESLVAIGRADKIFSEIPEEYEAPDARDIKNIRGEVKFQNISFTYDGDEQKVLGGISFIAEAGKMVAIVGKSGEGKSTLVDLISRYNIPQRGKILLDGMDIQKIKLKSLRGQIAIVPQEIDLFNDTIKNNIAYSKPGATEEEILNAAKLAYCHEFISEFPKKYEQIVGEKGVKLSTGQKQRVAIARAILRDPKILILDDATSALDSESEKYVQEALKEVMKNRTTFIIAHRLSTIRQADLILVLEDGKVVESGNHQELINHGGVYQKLCELQRISI